jgi:hypothetical protein
VIDASGLRDPAFDVNNRAFEVRGAPANLNLSRVTVASGVTTGGLAGNAILLQMSGTLSLTDSAVVNHTGMANGVALRSMDSNVTVLRTVFTNNESTTNAIGAIYATGTPTMPGSLTVGHSVFALNTVPASSSQYPNIRVTGSVSVTNQGYNLLDHHNATSNNFSLVGTDIQGTPDFVVTSVADSYSHVDNAFALSVREAVDLANGNAGEDTVWLPAWTYVLNRHRDDFDETKGGNKDVDTRFGDLDVLESLIVRRAGSTPSGPTVKWASGVVADAVFDLLGDYDGDGSTVDDDGDVDAADYVIWQNTVGTSDLRADGDDNGIIDDKDYDVWEAKFGNTLSLNNLG